METINKAVVFMSGDIVSEEASVNIYALVSNDNSFELFEHSPLTSKNKKKLLEIEYSAIEQLIVDCKFSSNQVTVIKHIYDEDPREHFFDRDSLIILSVKTNEKVYNFTMKGVRVVIPIIVDISNKHNIKLIENIDGITSDINSLSGIELYEKYIQPMIKYPTHIKNY